jgi:hypothetical protein
MELLGTAAGDHLEPGDRVQLGEVTGMRILRVRNVEETDAADRDDRAKLLPAVRWLTAVRRELITRGDDRPTVAVFFGRHVAAGISAIP